MTIFNAPSREFCIARRERTNTPLQALLLMNEQEYLKASRHLAHQTIAQTARSQPCRSSGCALRDDYVTAARC